MIKGKRFFDGVFSFTPPQQIDLLTTFTAKGKGGEFIRRNVGELFLTNGTGGILYHVIHQFHKQFEVEDLSLVFRFRPIQMTMEKPESSFSIDGVWSIEEFNFGSISNSQ